MKLYFTPAACSMAPHIVLNELGAKYEAVQVNLADKTFKGGNYLEVNPKGYVPALQLDSGEVLTEVGTIMQYLADQNPGAGLMPHEGTMDRYRCQEWLYFISTELHKSMGWFFKPNVRPETKEAVTHLLKRRFGTVAKHLETHDFLVGNKFSIADAYLFVMLNWTRFLNVDMSAFPGLMGYYERIKSRPSVIETMKKEGLLK